MSYTNTTELNLRKDGADEAVSGFRGVVNNNLDLIDAAYAQYLLDYSQTLENVAAIEGDTASTNYAVGSYLIHNGILYKVTSAIASGESITPGTNVVATSLNSVILSLVSSINELQEILNGPTVNSAYRGKLLGSGTTFANASTAAQRAAIADGSFAGLFCGDYWTINGTIYRIADSDYWYRSGESDLTTHHLVIVPDKNWGNDVMNSTNITTGAYCGSEMYTSSTSSLGKARTQIASDFGGYLLSHNEYLAKTVDSNGAQSEGQWVTSTVELMNEPMVYGCFINTKPKSDMQHLNTIDKSQLALFKLNPIMVGFRYAYWLRDVASSRSFARIGTYGLASDDEASHPNLGVRVVFGIKGTA